MLKTINRSITIPTLNTTSGEIENKLFHEDIVYKAGPKQGWTRMYKLNYDEIIMLLKSDLEKELFFHIRDSFTKARIEVPFNKATLAKKFKSTRPTVSRLFSKLVKAECLLELKDNKGIYRLNPYVYIPYGADGLLLQKEWNELTTEVTNNET